MKTLVKSLNTKALGSATIGLFLAFAASGQGIQDSLQRDDDNIVSSIAPYSSDVRDAILDVSQYPQKLVKIERMQARTSQSFQDLVEKYPRDVQEKLYDLSRYSELLNQLTDTGNAKSNDEVNSILASYPKEVANTVRDLYPSHFSDLKLMNKSYKQSDETLSSILDKLPSQTQDDFKKIIGMPDVMNILTDRIDLTVSLGEAYKNNPEGVRQNLATLNSQVTTQNAKDLDDYKQQVAKDPALQDEMKKSSQEFANNYSETDDGNPPVVNNYYTTNPYPYWFGYPYWYPSPVWYPRPLYYHTGFYLGAGGNMVVVGLPSYAYSNWFFGHGYRTYPRLYSRYNAYYNYHYRPNMNVYRGYNTAVRDHFNRINNNIGNQPRGRATGNTTINPQRGRPANNGRYNNNNVNGNNRSQSPSLGNRSQNFRNSGNNPGSNFNSQRFNNFQSQQFHQQNWGGMRGGMRSGESFNGGGNRTGGSMGGGSRGGRGSRSRSR